MANMIVLTQICIPYMQASLEPENVNQNSNKSSILRCFSFCGMMLLISLFLYHFSTLFAQFTDSPSTTQLRPNEKEFLVPDIHFCNDMPISISIQQHLAEGIKNTSFYPQFHYLTDKNRISINKIIKFWTSVSRRDVYKSLAKQLHQTIIFGASSNDFYNSRVKLEDVELIPNWNYLACYRYRPRKHQLQSIEDSLIFYFYLDAEMYPDSRYNYLFPYAWRPEYSQATDSISVYFTPPNQYPHVNHLKILLSGGYRTTVDLKVTNRALLPKSKGIGCVEEPLNISYGNFLKPGSFIEFEETIYDCLYLELQTMVRKKCQCYLYDYPLTKEMSLENVALCGANTTSVKEFEQVISCTLNQTKHLPMFNHKCQQKSACSTWEYSGIKTTSKWPKDGFVWKMISPMMNMSRIFNRKTRPGWIWLEKSNFSDDVIRQNFEMLVIKRGEMFSTLIKESWAYEFRNLMSDLAGILGFYVGFSLIAVVESVEVVIKMANRLILQLSQYRQKRRESKGDKSKPTDGKDTVEQQEYELKEEEELIESTWVSKNGQIDHIRQIYL